MKIKRKGKVYPSPSSSSSSSSSSYKDAISVLKLLPAAIFALALSLPVEDREVLAYMITRSMTTTNPPSAIDHQKKKCKRPTIANVQKHSIFECGCFDCYTSFWVRWDSSPNRELIHQAIEAFEDHLTHHEFSKRNGRGRKRDKVMVVAPLDDAGKPAEMAEMPEPESDVVPVVEVEVEVEAGDVGENEEKGEDERVGEMTENLEMTVTVAEVEVEVAEEEEEEEAAAATVQAPVSNHKGLARKVLPDVVGILNSRLWSLWSPNI